MLDSSPIASESLIPPIPPKLKRSASTASLPTPPRTRVRRRRGRKRAHEQHSDDDSASDLDELSFEDEPRGRDPIKKRRRVGEPVVDDEDAFWLGDSSSNHQEKSKAENPTEEAQAPPTPLIYRRLRSNKQEQKSSTVTTPVSPPPSHRKPPAAASSRLVPPTPPRVTRSAAASPKTPVASPPRTPKKRAKIARDSPENPFLATPAAMRARNTGAAEWSDDEGDNFDAPIPEKPTITYVFRGVRGVFSNPHYNAAKNRAFSPPPASRLPLDHPDYSPDPACLPRLRFPGVPRKKRVPATAPTPAASSKPSKSVSPQRSPRKTKASPMRLDEELRRASVERELNSSSPTTPRTRARARLERLQLIGSD